MRVVLDANIVISATITPEGSSGRILGGWRARSFVLCTDERILAEVERTLSDEGLVSRYKLLPETVAVVLSEIRAFATMPLNQTEPIHVVRDPKDNMVLECAVACEADLVVTNDDDLLALKGYEGIGIVSIRDFLRTLGLT